jgi:hypothetical protein
MLVLMLATTPGSDRDHKGIALPVRSYEGGKTYPLGDELAQAFISMGVAKDATEPKHEPKSEDQGPAQPVAASQNGKGKQVAQKEKRKGKNAGAAPENKSR